MRISTLHQVTESIPPNFQNYHSHVWGKYCNTNLSVNYNGWYRINKQLNCKIKRFVWHFYLIKYVLGVGRRSCVFKKKLEWNFNRTCCKVWIFLTILSYPIHIYKFMNVLFTPALQICIRIFVFTNDTNRFSTSI